MGVKLDIFGILLSSERLRAARRSSDGLAFVPILDGLQLYCNDAKARDSVVIEAQWCDTQSCNRLDGYHIHSQ